MSKVERTLHRIDLAIQECHKDGHFLDVDNDKARELYLCAMQSLYEAQSHAKKAWHLTKGEKGRST